MKVFGATYDPTYKTYFVPCYYMSVLPKITFFIEGKEYDIFGDNYVFEIHRKCMVLFEGHNDDDEHWTFGNTFLQTRYTIFDFENKRIGFAQPK